MGRLGGNERGQEWDGGSLLMLGAEDLPAPQTIPDPVPLPARNRLTRAFGPHAGAPKLIARYLDPLANYIAGKRAKRPTRGTGKDPMTQDVFKRLEGLSDPLLAYAVIAGVIDAAGAPPRDGEKSPEPFLTRIRTMGIRDRPISPRSPWPNPYAERLIGTLRRDCLDHVLIFG